jgi:hypothetical protein
VLNFGVRFSPLNVVDVPPTATSPADISVGDYTVFDDVLVDDGGQPVGSEAGTGVVTQLAEGAIRVHYLMTVDLADGQIAAQGLASTDPDKRLAVVGGTGSYEGASGTLDLHEYPDQTGTLTISLRGH